MVADIFLGWAVGELLSTALKRILLADVERLVETGSFRTPAVKDTLERPPTTMIGRDDELRAALSIAAEATTLLVTAVHGMGGVGKTALARAFAANVGNAFATAVCHR